MTFSCTQKVRDKLKKYKAVTATTEEVGVYNWYVDLIILEKKNYFLFTHSQTLFSFFVFAGTKKELMEIENIFEERLQKQIKENIGETVHLESILLKKDEPYLFKKTNSRSILGSINDFKFQIKIQIAHKGKLNQTYELINFLINQCPSKSLNFKTPSQEMKGFLEERVR